MTDGKFHRSKMTLLVLASALAFPAGCVLVGIEPDEIDVADDEGDTGGGDDIGDTGGLDSADEGETGDAGETTGDGDTTGQADTTGTDTSNSTDTSDSDTGPSSDTGTSETGMSDSGETGDTGSESDCESAALGEDPLTIDLNEISILEGSNLVEGDCGTGGPEFIGEFIAPDMGTYAFSVGPADFDGVIYFVDGACVQFEGESCAGPDASLLIDMQAGEAVLVAVESNAGAAAATLTITAQ